MEIYPKLIRLMNESAAIIVIYFITVCNKLDELTAKNEKIEQYHLISLLENYLYVFPEEEFSGAKEMQALNDQLAMASIFIPRDIYTKALSFKKDAAKLWSIFRKEIACCNIRKCSKEDLLTLIERGRSLIESLDRQKEGLAQAINIELGAEKKEAPKSLMLRFLTYLSEAIDLIRIKLKNNQNNTQITKPVLGEPPA